MYDQTNKRITVVVLVAAVVIPLVVMIWNASLGVILLLGGLITAIGCIRMLRNIDVGDTVQDQQRLLARQERGRTVYVELVDDDGNPLDSAAAEEKLARARLMADPRDNVVGIRRKLT